MTLTESLLSSWDKQAACLGNLMELIDEDLLKAEPSEDGMDIAEQLCHVHQVRAGWLQDMGEGLPEGTPDVYYKDAEGWHNIEDFETIKSALSISQKHIRGVMEKWLAQDPVKIGPYDNIADFHEHMVWHEGYHFALVMLAMRLAGREPAEEWENEKIWDNFRKEELL